MILNSIWFSYSKLSGRALEELRSTLYNELRTSEGAKRQQQRFCGPVVAMVFNFMVAVGIIMANKLVSAFPFLFLYVVDCVLSQI
jgi:cytochrome bd-type quinol oxidase subunit 1